jgi:hypothetical protein
MAGTAPPYVIVPLLAVTVKTAAVTVTVPFTVLIV